MNSTLTSNQETILEIKDLDISYNLARFKSNSLRDFFIEMTTSPLKFFFNRPKKLLILQGMSLTVKKGDILGLIGINGAGKTSLCRTISGMYGNRSEIKVNGTIRSIFDTASVIHPELSGLENAWIITNIIYSHLTKKERSDIVHESLDFSELDDFIHTPFKFYSKGMKVRLFLSIVSARPCDLLILDEVFNGADAFFNEKVSKRIKDVILKSGAVIFISHSEDLVKEICNRGVLIGNKKILFDGNINLAYDKYQEIYGESSRNENL